MAAKVLGTTGVLYNDRRRFYLAENEFAELYTSETPFLSGLMNMGSESVDDPDFKMFEYRAGWVEPKFLANGSSNGNYAPGADSISVATDGYAGVSAGDSIIGAVVAFTQTQATTKPTRVRPLLPLIIPVRRT